MRSNKFRVLAAHKDFLVEAKVHPAIPGNYYALPENCFPSSGEEIEVESISMRLGRRLREIEWDSINSKAQNDILYDISEQWHDIVADDRAEAAEYQRDR